MYLSKFLNEAEKNTAYGHTLIDLPALFRC